MKDQSTRQAAYVPQIAATGESRHVRYDRHSRYISDVPLPKDAHIAVWPWYVSVVVDQDSRRKGHRHDREVSRAANADPIGGLKRNCGRNARWSSNVLTQEKKKTCPTFPDNVKRPDHQFRLPMLSSASNALVSKPTGRVGRGRKKKQPQPQRLARNRARRQRTAQLISRPVELGEASQESRLFTYSA